MNWQVPRIDQGGAYGDPFAMPHPGGQGHLGQIMAPALSAEEQHFLSSCTTREYEEMARRKAEHMESAEHIAPQHNYPLPTKTSRLTEKVLRENFHLPLSEVAKKFGMCTTAFKKLCRKQGVMQWPHRTLRSLEKKIASLRAEQKFTNDHNQIDEQVRKLQMKREAILSGTGLANLEGDDLLTSPSDDSSSTACSGSSSPRAHDVLNALALDDSSSVGSSSSMTEDRHGSSSSSAGSLTARREGGIRDSISTDYPQMPGEGMLGSEKSGPWDKRMMMHPSGGHAGGRGLTGHEEDDDHMARDPFDTMPHAHETPEIMHRMRAGISPMLARGRMHGHEAAMPGDLPDRHEAQRRQMSFASTGGVGMSGMPTAMTGMHPQMLAESMHMGGRRYPAGVGGAGIPAGGMPPPARLGGRGGHMMWYKDMQHMGSPRDAHEHPGFPEGYMGAGMVHSSGMLAEHPASHARLQLQVNYLLAENHNLRCVIRSMSQERDDYARHNDGTGAQLANCRMRCQQLEQQLGMLQRGGPSGSGGIASGVRGGGREMGDATDASDSSPIKSDQQRHQQQQQAEGDKGDGQGEDSHTHEPHGTLSQKSLVLFK